MRWDSGYFLLIDLSHIPVNEGTNSRFRWTKYSDLYETVHLSLVLISMCLLTGALIFPCVIMMIFLFLLLKWGSPFHISPVASLGLLLYNLWQSNKLSEPNWMRERSIGGRGGQFPKKFSPKTTVYKSCKPFYLKKKKNLVIQKKKFTDSWLNKNYCPTHGISK